MREKHVTYTLRMPEQFKQELEVVAQVGNVSLNTFICNLLRAWVENPDKTVPILIEHKKRLKKKLVETEQTIRQSQAMLKAKYEDPKK